MELFQVEVFAKALLPQAALQTLTAECFLALSASAVGSALPAAAGALLSPNPTPLPRDVSVAWGGSASPGPAV